MTEVSKEIEEFNKWWFSFLPPRDKQTPMDYAFEAWMVRSQLNIIKQENTKI